ncbi:MAG: 5-oxoprolinase subunit PxpB [Elsteraceae bacterium]
MSAVKFLSMGDGGMTVEFGREVDPDVHSRVLALDAALAAEPITGVIEASPTYRSLFLQYDPVAIEWDDLQSRLTALIAKAGSKAPEGRRWVVPAGFSPEFGEDLPMVAETKGMTQEQLVAAFCAAEYRVYMIGFVPGFTYLGGLPEPLHLSRRLSPRLLVPAGSVAIGGVQAGMNPIDQPSGWHLLGKTPTRLFDLAREQPCIFAAGDMLTFEPIDADMFAGLADRAKSGDPIARLVS